MLSAAIHRILWLFQFCVGTIEDAGPGISFLVLLACLQESAPIRTVRWLIETKYSQKSRNDIQRLKAIEKSQTEALQKSERQLKTQIIA